MGRTCTHLRALKKQLEVRVRKAIFIWKDWSGDGIRDRVERYWLAPPWQSYAVSQGCCHRDDPVIIEAGSRPSLLLQGHMQTLLFSVRRTDVNRENTKPEPHRNTHTHTHTLHLLTTGCYAIITHKAFKDGTWVISSFTNDPRHSRWQSTRQGLKFVLMKSAKLMSWITMKTTASSSSSLRCRWKPETLDYIIKVKYCRECLSSGDNR